jgi:hypothetical protein
MQMVPCEEEGIVAQAILGPFQLEQRSTDWGIAWGGTGAPLPTHPLLSHPEARVPHLGRAPRRIARVSKDGHKRDRASGHPSRRRFAPPQDEVCGFKLHPPDPIGFMESIY